jgi:hypothetical protein
VANIGVVEANRTIDEREMKARGGLAANQVMGYGVNQEPA